MCWEFYFKSNVVFNVKKLLNVFLVVWLLNICELVFYFYCYIVFDNIMVFFFVKKKLKKKLVCFVDLFLICLFFWFFFNFFIVVLIINGYWKKWFRDR